MRVTLIVVGVINGLPVIGSLSPQTVQSLYGVTITNQSIILLLRHRAILFGLLGLFTIYASFHRELYTFATVQALVSMLSFVYLWYAMHGEKLSKMNRVALVDIAASVALMTSYFLYKVNSE